MLLNVVVFSSVCTFFFFNDTATTEIYTILFVGSVRCVQETDIGDHLIGNVYVKFVDDEDAKACKDGLTGRYYGGKLIIPEFSPVSDFKDCLLYTSPSPRDRQKSRMPSSA
eukprot:TRINITY_DN544_c0_g1_i4.p3 TRINITY_DN544_c0_g1~~TRINITY_DN544_c0_g1_i4.p3  ORF type:complete len:111 (-),score=29.11 TRINITY_DN544_c0_g1_i4:40-372(-)